MHILKVQSSVISSLQLYLSTSTEISNLGTLGLLRCWLILCTITKKRRKARLAIWLHNSSNLVVFIHSQAISGHLVVFFMNQLKETLPLFPAVFMISQLQQKLHKHLKFSSFLQISIIFQRSCWRRSLKIEYHGVKFTAVVGLKGIYKFMIFLNSRTSRPTRKERKKGEMYSYYGLPSKLKAMNLNRYQQAIDVSNLCLSRTQKTTNKMISRRRQMMLRRKKFCRLRM